MFGRQLFLASALTLCASSVAAQQYVPLPLGSWANDVTPDGEIVAGSYPGGGFVWRWRVDPAPTLIPGGDVVGVSDDGSVVAGTRINPTTGKETAAIWTAPTGWQFLGGLDSCDNFLTSAYDISGDGTAVVGLAWKGCSGRGFRWTAATGMQELQKLAGGNNRCSVISTDGSVLAGFAQGGGSRSPAYWKADTSGFMPNYTQAGEVYGLNHDGSQSVGTLLFTGGLYDAFLRDAASGALTNLGSLHSDDWAAAATDLSEDGSIIVGYDYVGLSRQAWIWTTADGMQSLNARLLAAGVTGVPELFVCRKVSDDGTVIVGGGVAGSGGPFGTAGFIVELPLPTQAWSNLGHGLAGTNGVPSLVGTGALIAGNTTKLALGQAKPNSAGAFITGLSTINAPFKQGLLVPFPSIVTLIPAVAPSGGVSLQFPWPAGVPSGVSAYWQCIIDDRAAPAGFSLSNALQGTTP